MNQYLNENCGQDLDELLIKFIKKYRKDGEKIHRFYKSKQDETLCFSIKIIPTKLQPGNCKVGFPNLRPQNCPSWSSLKEEVIKREFPQKRKKFFKSKLKDVKFNESMNKAFVLFSFEVARRVDDEALKHYCITREDTKRAIEKVMNMSGRERDYPNKVKFCSINHSKNELVLLFQLMG